MIPCARDGCARVFHKRKDMKIHCARKHEKRTKLTDFIEVAE